MSKKKKNVENLFCLIPDELIGEIIKYHSSPKDICSLIATYTDLFRFFSADNVYNKCVNVIFKLKSEPKMIMLYHVDALTVNRTCVTDLTKFHNLNKLSINLKRELRIKETTRLGRGNIIVRDVEDDEPIIKFMDELKFPEIVKNLQMSCNSKTSEDMWIHYTMFPESLESLDLSNNIFRAIKHSGGKNAYLFTTQLKKIVLHHCRITDEFMDMVTLPDKLEHLDLSNNKINKLHNFPILLKYLDLSNNIFSGSIELNLKYLGRLETLKFNNNEIDNDDVLEKYKFPEHLQYLELSNISIGDGVAKLDIPDSVINLDLSNNGIVSGIELLKIPRQLQVLNLHGNALIGINDDLQVRIKKKLGGHVKIIF